MGFTANVTDGDIIVAAWGNEVRDRTKQVFATTAERDQQWAAPPDGAVCVTTDTNTSWQRQAGAWQTVPIIRAAVANVTTDAFGNASVGFTPPMPAGVVPIVIPRSTYDNVILTPFSESNTGFGIGAKRLDASLVADFNLDCRYIAIGVTSGN